MRQPHHSRIGRVVGGHEALRRQERAVPTGDLVHGGWMLRLGLRGVPFGSADRWA